MLCPAGHRGCGLARGGDPLGFESPHQPTCSLFTWDFHRILLTNPEMQLHHDTLRYKSFFEYTPVHYIQNYRLLEILRMRPQEISTIPGVSRVSFMKRPCLVKTLLPGDHWLPDFATAKASGARSYVDTALSHSPRSLTYPCQSGTACKYELGLPIKIQGPRRTRDSKKGVPSVQS